MQTYLKASPDDMLQGNLPDPIEQISQPGDRSGEMKELIAARLLASAELKRRVVEHCMEDILGAAQAMAHSLQMGGKILLCGNGGSAADCQHIAAEFVNWLTKDFVRPGLAAIALTTDTSFLTAYANDCGFEGIFARQVQAIGRPEDVLIGISTSGSSANVMQAVLMAKSMGMQTIALTGSGGKLAEVADVTVAVPSSNTQHIQESHLAIEHVLCELVERYLFPERGT